MRHLAIRNDPVEEAMATDHTNEEEKLGRDPVKSNEKGAAFDQSGILPAIRTACDPSVQSVSAVANSARLRKPTMPLDPNSAAQVCSAAYCVI
jgi:hypothetical protein